MPDCEPPSPIHLSSLFRSRGVLPPVLRVLGEAPLDDPLERRRRHRRNRRDRRRLLLHDRGDQRRLARSHEGLAPGRHLVEHAPEREDVRPRVRLPALELLGRHVLERPEDRPFLRQVLVGRPHHRRQRGHGRLHGRRHRLGEAEVEQLHARLRQHDVAGLQVAVHDPLPVGLVESVGDLRAEPQRLLERQRSLAEAVRRASRPREAPSRGTRRRPGCRRRRGRRCASGKAAKSSSPRARSAGGSPADEDRCCGQHLDRDRAIEPRVLRPVDLAHPARANRRDDLVRP